MDGIQPVERLVTVREAARLLGISRHLIFQADSRGELAIFEPGRWARVRLTDVGRWLERTRRRPGGGR